MCPWGELNLGLLLGSQVCSPLDHWVPWEIYQKIQNLIENFCQLTINYRISLSLHNARNLTYHEKKFHSSLWPAFLSPKKFFWHQIWVSRIFWQFFSPLNDFKKVSYFISSFAFGSTRKIILDFFKIISRRKESQKTLENQISYQKTFSSDSNSGHNEEKIYFSQST